MTAHEAAQKRDVLINEIKQPIEQATKVRVGEFAQSWIESKTLKLDSSTAKTYGDALDRRVEQTVRATRRTGVRYANDLVVMCKTANDCREQSGAGGRSSPSSSSSYIRRRLPDDV